MNRRDYLIVLYDYYSELFNDKQRSYFEDYYFNNLSLSEISDNIGISRNAIHKVIKSVEDKLLFYEEKLKIYDKDLKLRNIINNVDDKEVKSELERLV
ncbi:MAG: hypothetical protein VZS44_00155 [Bacilli bacterium]|nr:hypothetical protein [Bacilli bacterium]